MNKTFVRQDNTREFFDELEGMRGVAALSVFAFHIWVVLGRNEILFLGLNLTGVPAHGALGVSLFFVLSAFLLGLSWVRGYDANRPPLWQSYARRRILRIVPAYYASVLILAVWSPPSVPGYGTIVVTVPVVLAHLVFAPYLAMSPALNGVYWSLSTEIQFYIALPFLAVLFARNRWPIGLGVCFVATILWRLIIYVMFVPGDSSLAGVDVNSYLNTMPLMANLGTFATGILMAVVWSKRGSRNHPVFAVITTLSGILFVVLSANMSTLQDSSTLMWWIYYLFQGTPAAIGFGLILLGGIFGATAISKLWTSWPIRLAGVISYSIYLWHLPLLLGIKATFGGVNDLPVLLLVTVAIILVLFASTLSYFAFERPFMKGGHQISSLFTSASTSWSNFKHSSLRRHIQILSRRLISERKRHE